MRRCLPPHRLSEPGIRGRWESIADHVRIREVRQLTRSFNQMARELNGTLTGLEDRVQERTRDLAAVNRRLEREIAGHRQTEADRERLIGELRAALEKVKLLSGLLPICSHCKKIRDDSGRWHDVAAYVGARSHAEFSHGICPECMAEFYPGFSRKKT